MTDDDLPQRKAKQAGDDIIQVLAAQNLDINEALTALGSVIIGILKAEDNHDLALRHAIKLCFIIMLEIDPNGMFEKAKETAQSYPGGAKFLADLQKMKQKSR